MKDKNNCKISQKLNIKLSVPTVVHMRKSISRYEEMTSSPSRRSVCASCGKLVPEADIFPVNDGDPLLLPLGGALDRCGRHKHTGMYAYRAP
jgi:hypothetical protein